MQGLGIGGGAAEGLESVLKRLFLEGQARQQAAEFQAQLQQRQQESDANQALAQQRMGLEGRRIGLDESEFGFKKERTGVDDQRYAEAAPARESSLRHMNAQTSAIEAAPAREQAQQDFTTSRDKTLHGYRLGEIGAGAANREEDIVQVMGPQGTPIWVKKSQAVGQPAAQAPRAVTGAERQSLSYYNRAKQATDDISPIEEQIAKSGLGAQLQLQHAPNMLQNQTQQSYRQAQRAFTEARLRKESGAAIPTAEYENDARTYFAQPGDTPQTMEQKRKARGVVLEGLKFSSGKAYNEFYGEAGATGKPTSAKDPLGIR